MEQPNTLSRNLDSTERKMYDAACKRLLSNKVILAWIMKSCLEEYRDCSINDIAEHYIEGVNVGRIRVLPDETKPSLAEDYVQTSKGRIRFSLGRKTAKRTQAC